MVNFEYYEKQLSKNLVKSIFPKYTLKTLCVSSIALERGPRYKVSWESWLGPPHEAGGPTKWESRLGPPRGARGNMIEVA